MTKRLHVNTTEGANNPRQAWSRSPSPLTSEAQFLTFHPQRPPPSWSHRPLHPITMKRPIRQISKDGRRRVITHDVSGQIEKKKKKELEKKNQLRSNLRVRYRPSTQSPRHHNKPHGRGLQTTRQEEGKKGRDLNQSLRWPG